MTTPDLALPIGITMVPVANRDYLETPVPLPGMGDYRDIPLVRGVNMVSVSWNGPENITLYVTRPGKEQENISIFSAGTLGQVRKTIVEIGSEVDGARFRLRIIPRVATVTGERRATILVIPTPAPV